MSGIDEFKKFRDERNAALEREGHKPGSKWHVNNSHYQTWQAARAQGGEVEPECVTVTAIKGAPMVNGYQNFEYVREEVCDE